MTDARGERALVACPGVPGHSPWREWPKGRHAPVQWGKPRMADVGTRASRFSLRDITNYQWLVLFVAWAGWSLDITDFTLYGLVLRQSLTELLGSTTPLPEVLKVGGIITTIGLLGWAVGG